MKLLVFVIFAICFFQTASVAQSHKHHKRPVKADVTEKKISVKDIPSAVMDTFHLHYPTAVIKGQEKQTREKVVFYQIESADSGKSRDILFQTDGVIVEVAVSLEPEELPENIRSAVMEKYPDGKITNSVSVTRGDHVEFELTLKTGSHSTDVVVNMAGKVFPVK